ncbi:MAG: hypothetical protein RL318_2450 [Fibrobacterota bacterium]|jgi:hypothetical protein
MLGGVGGSLVGAGIGAGLGAAAGLAMTANCKDSDSAQRECAKLFLATTAAVSIVGAVLCLPAGVGGAVYNASSKQVRSEHQAVPIVGATLGALAGLSGLTLANGGKLSRAEPLPAAFWLLLSSSAGGVLLDRVYAQKVEIQTTVWQPTLDAIGLVATLRF